MLSHHISAITLLLLASATLAAGEPMVPAFDRFADDEHAELGRVLLSELSCTACHQANQGAPVTLAPKGGPRLTGAARRINPSWLRKFLADPQQAKPGSTMPQVLGHLEPQQREQAIAALIAYLNQDNYPQPKIVSTASSPVAPEFWRKGDAVRGQSLYHHVGCVACHAPDEKFRPERKVLSELEQRIEKLDLDPEELKQLGLALPQPIDSTPLPDFPAKYTPQSLTLFLVDPLLLRPSGRMPHMKLNPDEAADIAAYLLRVPPGAAPEPSGNPHSANDERLVRKGAKWYQQLGCAACHGPVGASPNNAVDSPAAKAPSLAALMQRHAVGDRVARGCIATDSQASAVKDHSPTPQFDLSSQQRAAIIRALRDPSTVERLEPAEVTSTLMLQLNCYACHQRDERGGVGPERWQFFENKRHVDLGDEGRMPPPLDHVGLKLKGKWLEQVLQGKGDVRPHLQARMPRFPRQAKQLADSLKSADPPQTQSLPPLALEKLKPYGAARVSTAGRKLLNTGCVQCHPLWDERLPGVMGVDISDIDRRIEPEWFQAFLKDPAQWKHNTRMPTFFPKGKSTSPELLGGDVEAQIAAMWTYLNAAKGELPEKLEQGRAHNFELTPKERPIVLRTFMEGNITHAIAVGFPERMHYAFDSELMALPMLWRGKFLNAHPTWFDRFTPPTKPLGQVWRLPPLTYLSIGPQAPAKTLPDAKLSNRLAPQVDLSFRGYRIDRQGAPTLLYRHKSLRLAERIAPANGDSKMALRRRITVVAGDKTESSTWWLAIALDPQQVSSREARLAAGRTVRSSAELKTGTLAGAQVLLTPLHIEAGKGSVEVQYQWND